MRILLILALLNITWVASARQWRPRNYDSYDYYVLQLESVVPPELIENKFGFVYEGQLGELKDHHVFSIAKHNDDLVHNALKARRAVKERRLSSSVDVLDRIQFAQKQKLRPRLEKRGLIYQPVRPPLKRHDNEADAKAVARQQAVATRLGIGDPIFFKQWHLFNPIQLGNDINVTDVWFQGITGLNTTVAIVDDGLDMYSDDLKDNYYPEGSYDFNDQTAEPKPKLPSDNHGTRCAGEVSAVKNKVCGIGVAYGSKIAGIRILSKSITDADEAIAMNYAYQHNDIYSCSWGPPDDGKSMKAPGILIKRAIVNAVQNGRQGKGSIFVFATGNGAENDDNCNFDGYANSIYTITVGAVDREGIHPWYSENCSAQLVVTYSSGSDHGIHTTDVGTNKCTFEHTGTSAAAPLAAGIFALVLQIRPDLTWRDMQYLVMQTALPIDLDCGEWQNTTIGKKYSHAFGYGKIDAWATVEAAKTLKNLKPQAWFYSPWMYIDTLIPQGKKGLAVSFAVSKAMLLGANLERLEHVQITMNINHSRRGDLSVTLISPDNIVSYLSVTRRDDNATTGYIDWTFMSVAHWGESGLGKWTLIVQDTEINKDIGTFIDWRLQLWGESIDPHKAKVLPMPEETDNNYHDQFVIATAISATYSSIPQAAAICSSASDPADHPYNPVDTNSSSLRVEGTSHTATSTISASAATLSTSSDISQGLTSSFPTFGLSSYTQVWVFGSIGVIIFICAGLGICFYIVCLKHLRNKTYDVYEFNILQDESAKDLTGQVSPSLGKGDRRADELYDTFSVGSDEDDEFSDEEYSYDYGGSIRIESVRTY